MADGAEQAKAGQGVAGRLGAREPRFKHLSGDFSGGLAGGIGSAAANIPIGLIACGPAGAALAVTGTLAIFFGCAIAGAVFVLLCRTPGLQAGGSLPNALITAGMVASLVGAHAIDPTASDASALLAVIMLQTVFTAFFIGAFGITGLGRLVPMIPYPVIAGILNGGAALMVLAQYHQAIGLDARVPGTWAHPGAAVVAGATFALMNFPVRRLRLIPTALIAVLGGTAVHYALLGFTPAGFMGPVTGALPSGLAFLHDVAGAWRILPHLPIETVLATITPGAFSIAILSTFETLTGASTMQEISGRHGSAVPDQLALAAGNLIGGLFCTMSVTSGSNASGLVWAAGGRTKVAGLIRSLLMLLIITGLSDQIADLPLAVVAGFVFANAWRLVDRDSLRFARLALRRRAGRRTEIAGNILIVLAVIAAAVLYGMAAGVVTGVILSLLLFATGMAQSGIRRVYTGATGRSRTTRAPRQSAILAEHGAEIAIVELQGAIFFGSVDQVARRVEALVANGARHVILDLRHVTTIDLSGARRLLQLAERFWRAGLDLNVSHVRAGGSIALFLDEIGLYRRLPADRLFSGLEDAVLRAEELLLAEKHAAGANALTPADGLEAIGLSPESALKLAPMLPVLALVPGERLIEAGRQSAEFFLLLQGLADVLAAVPGSAAKTRLITLTPGLLVGEMAYLTRARRSADVIARTDLVCLCIEAATMDALRQTDPETAFQLMEAIARQLERNLRTANFALVTLEE